jgi:hypothetical protein
MNATTPKGHEKNVTGQGKPVAKRGEGLGTGPVGQVQPGRPIPKKPEEKKK